MADQVLRGAPVGPLSPIAIHPQRKCTACEAEEKESLRRQAEEDEEELQLKPDAGGSHSAAVESAAAAIAQGGRSLSPAERALFEPCFGHDFSQVRLHTDRRAAASARALNARAYTVGTHIAFASGPFAAATPAGRRLLAHELTHVIQQGYDKDGTVQRAGPVVVQPQGMEEEEGSAEQFETPEVQREVPNVDSPQRRLVEIQRIDGRYTSLFQTIQITDNESLSRALAWETFYRNVGSAFVNAMTAHEKAVEAANDRAKDREEMVGAVLSIVGVGLAAYAFNLLQAGSNLVEAQTRFVNSLEDSVQQGVDKAVGKIPRKLSEHQKSIRAELPQSFQNAYMNQVSQAHQTILAYLILYETLVSDQQKSSREWLLDNIESDNLSEVLEIELDRFDELEKVVSKVLQTINESKMFTSPRDVDMAALQREIERGVWVKWIPRMCTSKIKEVTRPPGMTGEVTKIPEVHMDCKWPEEPIEARFKETGILGDADLVDVSRWKTYSWMAERLVLWARDDYRPVVIVPDL